MTINKLQEELLEAAEEMQTAWDMTNKSMAEAAVSIARMREIIDWMMALTNEK